MGIYSNLFESTIYCCDRIGFRHGLVYTVTMVTLSVGFCLDLLILVNLLWTFGVLHDPYRSGGSLHPQRYVYALVYVGFIANTVLARIKYNADSEIMGPLAEIQPLQGATPKVSLLRTPGAAYVLGSSLLFLVTLIPILLMRR